MSKYLETIGRLKRESWADTDIHQQPGIPGHPESAQSRQEHRSRRFDLLHPELQDVRSGERLSHLSDGIRALTHSNSAMGVVMAGVGHMAHIDIILNRTRVLAAHRGFALTVAELLVAKGSRILRIQPDQRTDPLSDPQGFASKAMAELAEARARSQIDLSSGWQEAENWLKTVADNSDLTLIKAPPILEQVDGALLGKVAGGLVLVIELRRTTREQLLTAVERVRSSDCPILGIVTMGPESPVPKWVTRLIASVEGR